MAQVQERKHLTKNPRPTAPRKKYPGLGWILRKAPPASAAIAKARAELAVEMDTINQAAKRIKRIGERLQRGRGTVAAEVEGREYTMEAWYADMIRGFLDDFGLTKSLRDIVRGRVWLTFDYCYGKDLVKLAKRNRMRDKVRALIAEINRKTAAGMDCSSEQKALRAASEFEACRFYSLDDWHRHAAHCGVTLKELMGALGRGLVDNRTGRPITLDAPGEVVNG